MIGFKHPDVCIRNVIFPLINSDIFLSNKELKIEQMEPEKMVIGIRSFIVIVTDLENCDQLCPPFPTGSIPNPFTDISATSAPLHRPQVLADPRVLGATETPEDQTPVRPVNTSKLSDNIRGSTFVFVRYWAK